eukprot:c7204_g1_i1.p1 GENE.c7204_g1_i1~~c7204_g1_i1.p1  ORF type:complete len:278 (+),score=53.02 c7204_g1_i1:29-835(+)
MGLHHTGFLLVFLVLSAHAEDISQTITKETAELAQTQTLVQLDSTEIGSIVKISLSVVFTIGILLYLKMGPVIGKSVSRYFVGTSEEDHYVRQKDGVCPKGSFPFFQTLCQKCDSTLLTIAPKDGKVRFLQCVPKPDWKGSAFLSHSACWNEHIADSYCSYPMEKLEGPVTVLPFKITSAKIMKIFSYVGRQCALASGAAWNYYSGTRPDLAGKPMLPVQCEGKTQSLVFTSDAAELVADDSADPVVLSYFPVESAAAEPGTNKAFEI